MNTIRFSLSGTIKIFLMNLLHITILTMLIALPIALTAAEIDIPNLPIPPSLQNLQIPPGVDPMEFIASLPDDMFMQLMGEVDDIVKNLPESERKKLETMSQKMEWTLRLRHRHCNPLRHNQHLKQ